MAKEKEKCGCRPIVGILSIVLMTLGIYFLVWGFWVFMMQTKGTVSWSLWNWSSLLSFFIGVILMGFGKMAHHKGYANCKIHS